MNKKTLATVLTVLLLVTTAVSIGVIFYFGEKGPGIKRVGDEIVIEGMFGTSIPVSDIHAIILIDKSMLEIDDSPGTRTNGYGGVGNTEKGEFTSEQLGPHRRYVYATAAPTIHIECKDGEDVYISYRDAAQTLEVYDLLALK